MTLVACLLACCSGPEQRVDATAELLQADRDFARATAENGVEGWVAWFAQDGAMVGRGGEPVRGRHAIRELMAPFFGTPGNALDWEPREARASERADLGYTLGRYESRAAGPDGEVRISRGTYLSVWRRQGDGTWKVELDMGSPDPPAPEILPEES
jgi:uncharacterized protein (TIGR02246 family)